MTKLLILIIAVILIALLSVPTTWLLMLFLGNIGVNVSFWGALPGAMVLGVATGGVNKK